MPQKSWSAKRERQYAHIKDGLLERGKGEAVAAEIAARTFNKERAQHGESEQASASSINDISASRRGGLRSHQGACLLKPIRPAGAPHRQGHCPIEHCGDLAADAQPMCDNRHHRCARRIHHVRHGRDPQPARGSTQDATARRIPMGFGSVSLRHAVAHSRQAAAHSLHAGRHASSIWLDMEFPSSDRTFRAARASQRRNRLTVRQRTHSPGSFQLQLRPTSPCRPSVVARDRQL